MKRIVQTPKTVEKIVEKVTTMEDTIVDQAGGLDYLLGKLVYVQCASYAYSGILTGMNEKFFELSETVIVYETGDWNAKKWQDSQKLPCKTCAVFFAFAEAMFEVVR